MRAIDVLSALINEAYRNGNVEPTQKFAEREREVADIIARVRNSLDMDAVKEDVRNIIREILSNTAGYTDYLKSILHQQSTPSAV